MSDHYVLVCQRMSDQVVVSYLQEGIDGCRLILLLCGPVAYRAKLGCRSCSGLHEKTVTMVTHPVGQLVASSGDFIRYFVDTEDTPFGVFVEQPLPKGRTKIQPVV